MSLRTLIVAAALVGLPAAAPAQCPGGTCPLPGRPVVSPHFGVTLPVARQPGPVLSPAPLVRAAPQPRRGVVARIADRRAARLMLCR